MNCNNPSMRPVASYGKRMPLVDNMVIDNMPIGMTYVPWQRWTQIYDPCKALRRGTIFAQLDKPFLGGPIS